MTARLVLAALAVALCLASVHALNRDFQIDLLGSTFNPSRKFNNDALASIAYDASTQQVYAANAGNNSLDVFDLRDPVHPGFVTSLSLAAYGQRPTAVATANGVLAVTVVADVSTLNGRVVIFDSKLLTVKQSVEVGPYPADVAFTFSNSKILVANSGRANEDYSQDPDGSISVVQLTLNGETVPINVQNLNALESTFKTTSVFFKQFNPKTIDPRIRYYATSVPSDPTLSEDLEPTSIKVSPRSDAVAYIILQSNNAVAEISLVEPFTITQLYGLDSRDFSKSGKGFDGSRGEKTPANETDVEEFKPQGEINIARWPALGLKQPNSFDCFVDAAFVPVCVTANTGTSRSHGQAYTELAQLKNLPLNTTLFPEGIQNITQLGELRVSTLNAYNETNGLVETIYVPGARSFSVLDMASRSELFESGDALEKLIRKSEEDNFNSLADVNDSFDQASIFQGPEPNAVATAVIDSANYFFLTLKQQGGLLMYEAVDASAPVLVGYKNNRDFKNTSLEFAAGDLGPSDVIFVSSAVAPTDDDYVVVANGVSATLTVFRINRLDASPSVPLPSLPSASASTLFSLGSLLLSFLALFLAF
eukprot:TRINITY_DN472_c0_g1_i1.p1 TRINITY_DN472_c0_g1~~TRINITY_DN472_c0_g1_i1.p1  ORF type:complete len:593 (-),score=296.55 TRINITY_DN472_c0_g1_i1:64-1842(-)